MDRREILNWLRETDATRLGALWRRADSVRRMHVGDEIYLRALIEISNYCRRECHYCGLRAPNTNIERYRLTAGEILRCARQAAALGLGTVVLQAGEDAGLTAEFIAGLIRSIKRHTSMAVTLSLGERSAAELAAWREAGADRYLLRFETSNPALYRRIHPAHPGAPVDRIALLRLLRELGYEVGSGVMVGIPGQTVADLADDIELFRTLNLDMIGVGPYIPHPGTPLASLAGSRLDDSISSSPEMTYKVVAIARLVCPSANIPSTTALASADPAHGREYALKRGANIVMPNFTPSPYRSAYDVYPGKASVYVEAESGLYGLERRIVSMGRTIGVGRGDSPNRMCRRADQPALEGAFHD